MRKLLVNRIITPDGTALVSRYRHDFVTHRDKNGKIYTNDGGIDYRKRAYHEDAPYKEASLYTDSPFEEIREVLCRGSRGINGDEPFTYTKLSNINLEWLKNIILYEQTHRKDNPYLPIYIEELKYRKQL